MLKLYGNYKSGNVYKVSLLLHLLGRPYQEVQIGLGPNTESQTSEYLAINPLGQIPVLETNDGKFISQSNAILWYLAQSSEWATRDDFEQARALQWMFFEQYELEPNLAMARWICHLKNLAVEMRVELEQHHSKGHRALGVVEAALRDSAFIVADRPCIADIALFAYIHNCAQGRFSLENYPAIRSWIARIEALPRFFPMSRQFAQFDYR